ncbi:DNA-3-methyladenine glycosylase I [Secundilactobacillus pentosiphilus]|uniref:DNA-3-methyladenine glycosylase I n=1 Tax=Secundilactobacillus pentosiphilus TaxID=1714682 RepID=A0A1Z5IRM1_9LACO|nr:DNA-3-methyladenine glycosylase I [Secundilactobacillus pentosiphilus]GAX04326.1 DNA-3-methyladenine glycosylase I [Secundilactobacillus pentosiphilus]GAX06183.1 DNA-3-methyladenine glycosylase I [Secundilactobacillus pentosiphilus]
MTTRCSWAEKSPQLLIYHDLEWGVPVHDERQLFENLSLEIFQAGLTWHLILKYREALRGAFEQFDPERLAQITPVQLQALHHDHRIIRNQQKIDAVIENARVLSSLHELGWTLSDTLWQRVNGSPLDHHLKPKETLASDWFVAELAQTLRQLGFKRVGPKTCYSLLQASGIVNDHLATCYRHDEITQIIN